MSVSQETEDRPNKNLMKKEGETDYGLHSSIEVEDSKEGSDEVALFVAPEDSMEGKVKEY